MADLTNSHSVTEFQRNAKGFIEGLNLTKKPLLLTVNGKVLNEAGIAGFSKSLARELGSRNITVNCVAPGFIDTDMSRDLPEQQRNALLAQIPLGRLGRPEDIAAAVAYLASPAAAYITGAVLHVNGGMYMS